MGFLLCSTSVGSSLIEREQVESDEMVEDACQYVLLSVTVAPHCVTVSIFLKIRKNQETQRKLCFILSFIQMASFKTY